MIKAVTISRYASFFFMDTPSVMGSKDVDFIYKPVDSVGFGYMR